MCLKTFPSDTIMISAILNVIVKISYLTTVKKKNNKTVLTRDVLKSNNRIWYGKHVLKYETIFFIVKNNEFARYFDNKTQHFFINNLFSTAL